MAIYTGGEIISKYLIKEGVKYVIGIPGHGNLPLVDAFFKDKDKLTLIQPKQEMSAVHMAVDIIGSQINHSVFLPQLDLVQ